jgi:hypothetical protein
VTRPFREHGVFWITCPCGRGLELRDTTREAVCPDCERRLVIEFSGAVVEASRKQ